MSYKFIPLYRGIKRIRFLTVPLPRQVHWHLCPDGKRRPIDCSLFDCILCLDTNIRNNLFTGIGYDYRSEGIIELNNSLSRSIGHATNKDPRYYDISIEAITPMKEYVVNVLSDRKKIIKPSSEMMLELANKLSPPNKEMVIEQLYNFDPTFKRSTILKEEESLYNKAFDSAISYLKDLGIDIISYRQKPVRPTFIFPSKIRSRPVLYDFSLQGRNSIVLPNKNQINIAPIAASIKNNQLYSHATDKIINAKSYGNKMFNVALLLHENGDFKFEPGVESIINESKFEGILK